MSKGSSDSAERALFLRLAAYLIGVCIVFGSVIGFVLFHQKRIGAAGFVGAILLGLVSGIVLAGLVWGGTSMTSRALVTTITGAGNIKPAPSYSFQESLIARGKLKEAEESFLAHLAATPGDRDAGLALAALYRDHLGDPARAERLFLEIRQSGPTPAQEFAIANALIDLYRATGQTGREMAELARFADRYRGSEAAAGAAAALRRLKARPG